MFAWLFLWLVLGIWLIVGAFAYVVWKRRRQPARHRRWWVLGMCTGAVGYVHTLAYGFALTRPTEVCGQRTFDDDFPLTHVRVDMFPPRLACYWTDSAAYGPSHPTAAGTWLLWCGAALLVAGTVAWAMALSSRTPRWARAGTVLAPAAAATIWATGVAPLMRLSAVDLDNECFRWQVAHLHSAPSGEIVHTELGFLPPAVDCVFTDGTASLIRVESLGLSWCLTVFIVCCAALRLLKAPMPLRSHKPR
ncbi:hypothetical protein QT196_05080 [Streptomyces sp. P9-2B-2]|uniref:hypothetical protein n=1 Tax=Streptomyces TaxID=1883 RepID=UPI0022538E76|nr:MULTISPECIES: hypothetical protein [Streptomyces]MCX4637124.1 hypothetical protein [Streptomyces platensis]WJY36700.1 hypothetical protein QT196_05080 [Streptomyces sp. P9-2B-2]